MLWSQGPSVDVDKRVEVQLPQLGPTAGVCGSAALSVCLHLPRTVHMHTAPQSPTPRTRVIKPKGDPFASHLFEKHTRALPWQPRARGWSTGFWERPLRVKPCSPKPWPRRRRRRRRRDVQRAGRRERPNHHAGAPLPLCPHPLPRFCLPEHARARLPCAPAQPHSRLPPRPASSFFSRPSLCVFCVGLFPSGTCTCDADGRGPGSGTLLCVAWPSCP